MLYIEYDERLAPEGGVLLAASIATLTKSHSKDPAGHAFHELALKQAGLYAPASDASDSGDDSSSVPLTSQHSSASLPSLTDEQPPPGCAWVVQWKYCVVYVHRGMHRVQWKGKGKKKKKQVDDGRVDLYALLGLQNERYLATDADIKNAYRRLALELHPDKCAVGAKDDADREAIEARFKQFQAAYETLSNTVKRREFDSTDAFDDTLPYDCDPADFFKVFAPAFRRNSRWSNITPVPDVGDENTPWDDVDEFYVFWFNFRSWREFPHPDEEDVEQAENREHARYIKRYNAKLRERAKKEEKARLKEFVEAAFKRDPRVIAHKEAEKAKRDAKRLEKEAAAQRQAEEAARAAEEAAARAAEEAIRAAEAKKARQVEKKALQKERSRLRTLLLGNVDTPPVLDTEYGVVEKLCGRMGLDALRGLTAALGRGPDGAEDALQRALAAVDAQDEEVKAERAQATQRAAQQAEQVQANKAAARAAWTTEEVRLLHKGIDKFPVGTARRWEQVAAYVRTRTVDEVLDMVKHGSQPGGQPPAAETWKLTSKQAPVITAAPDTRMSAFSDVDINIKGAAAAALQSEALCAKPVADKAPDAAKAADPKAVAGEWSEEQEVALVKALKATDKGADDRWEQVALMVPGKTKAACFKRFKELKENFKAKKAG